MPPAGGKSSSRRAPKNGGIGSAVLHHCLRQQAENAQRHQALIRSLKQNEVGKTVEDMSQARVALDGTISRHRTLEFLAGTFTAANPSKGSAHSKHTDQHLRSILERNGLDEYLCTALAAQETFSVDRYEARLLHESTAPQLLSHKSAGEDGGSADLAVEARDVHIPRRPVFFSRDKAEACKESQPKEQCEGTAARSRRRRNRARVKLLLAGKVEEATIHNVQFVRQQRGELQRRFQKQKDAKLNRRRGRQLGSSKLSNENENWDEGSEASWESEASQSVADGTEEAEGDAFNTSDSNNSAGKHSPKQRLTCVSDSEDSEAEEGEGPPGAQEASAVRLPRTAAELDEVEFESFLQWRRSLAKMEDEGIVLTPYEKNLEVWRQLWRVVERSHLVLQIIDGRSPAFFRCKDLEKYVKEVSPDKRVILVVNKSDLLPSEVREEWKRYFASNGVDAIFFSALRELNHQAAEVSDEFSFGSQTDSHEQNPDHHEAEQNADMTIPNLSAASAAAADADTGSTENILSCKSMVDLLVQYRDEFLATRAARQLEGEAEPSEDFVVGTVGYPNVGKSSLINALLGIKKVSVSHQPGKTRRLQTIPLKGQGITLCDCPGLVFPKAVASKHILVLNGVVPIDEMRGDYLPSVQLVCDEIPNTLLRHYGLTASAYREAQKLCRANGTETSSRLVRGRQQDTLPGKLEAAPVLLAIAAQRHFVSGGKGGQLDMYRVAKIILRDFTTGRLLRCQLPGGGIFGFKAEAAEAAKVLSAVQSPMETRLGEKEEAHATEEVGTREVSGNVAAYTTERSSINAKQMNPIAVLQELEEDLDLLEIMEQGEACQAGVRQAPHAMTKRKARQLQKQMQKGNGDKVGGFVYRR